MIILTNLIMFAMALYYFRQLWSYNHRYSRQKALFILMIGISGIFGSIAHAVHFQLGDTFFNTVLFLMNSLSLLSILFCFSAAYYYLSKEKGTKKWVNTFVWLWVIALLIITFLQNEFVLVKIHAGIVLVFSLIVYSLYDTRRDPGSKYIVSGILVAFLSIITHSLRINLHEWFNYKDISHVIMIVSLYLIYKGADLNSENLLAEVSVPVKD
ncbi:MAG: hypothetical protein JNK73_13850 [Bacteroidia bacterium]|nr:hypothetical protein [Bacteroidia bacterium]